MFSSTASLVDFNSEWPICPCTSSNHLPWPWPYFGMIERRDGVSFLLETRRVLALQALDGDDAVEARVARLVDLSHASRANRREDFVRTKFVAWLKRHRVSRAKFSRSEST